MIPTWTDEELDYIETNDYAGHELEKICPTNDCSKCPISKQCRKRWDSWATRVEDKKLKKSEIKIFLEKRINNIQTTLGG